MTFDFQAFLTGNKEVATGIKKFQDAGIPGMIDGIYSNPDSPVSVAFADSIEKFSRAMTRPNSYKKVQDFLRNNPDVVALLPKKKADKAWLMRQISQSPHITMFISEVKSGKLNYATFQGFIGGFLSSQDIVNLMVLMSDHNMSFCRILSECFKIEIKPTDKIQIINFPESENGDGIIEAEWIIDIILKYIIAIMNNYVKSV